MFNLGGQVYGHIFWVPLPPSTCILFFQCAEDWEQRNCMTLSDRWVSPLGPYALHCPTPRCFSFLKIWQALAWQCMRFVIHFRPNNANQINSTVIKACFLDQVALSDLSSTSCHFVGTEPTEPLGVPQPSAWRPHAYRRSAAVLGTKPAGSNF